MKITTSLRIPSRSCVPCTGDNKGTPMRFLIPLFLAASIAVSPACSSFTTQTAINTANAGVSAMTTSLATVVGAFLAWDAIHQRAIADGASGDTSSAKYADYQLKVTAYRTGARARILTAINVALADLKAANDALQAISTAPDPSAQAKTAAAAVTKSNASSATALATLHTEGAL